MSQPQAIENERSIFILRAKPDGLRSAEDYLVHRKWTVHSSVNVKSALTIIMTLKPAYCLLSVENSFAMMSKLPALIEQAFPGTTVVLYSEGNSPQSFNSLRDWGANHTLYPPVTGPAIERLILRVQRGSTLIPSGDTLTVQGRVPDPHSIDRARSTLASFFNSQIPMHPAYGMAYQGGSTQSGAKPGDDSLMAAGTQWAIENSATFRIADTIGKVKKASNVTCISVQSSHLSGLLVAAFGDNRKVDESFIDLVRDRLQDFMATKGEELSSDAGFDLKIEEVEFEGWALMQAEFLRKTIHDGNEIAMAFFPPAPEFRELEVSGSEKMLMMDMDEIVGNATVEFDLYVYLPANGKYILYTRKGEVLPADQRDRLAAKGVRKMHLRKDTKSDVRRYRVRNYLNSKIAAFKKNV